MVYQTPEQKAREQIDKMLNASGWAVQSKSEINLSASYGVAVREYYTEIGPADYVLFADKRPVGILEAKKETEGLHLRVAEDQAEYYAKSKLKYLNNDPLPFVYESTGVLTNFTDMRDPKPRSRPVFSFHRPETLIKILNEQNSLRTRLHDLPELPPEGLRAAQFRAINNLEVSFKANKPKALIQMATGAGKTFTACTFVYRLLKHAKAKRILFLVDTRNLGEQAEQEFLKYQPVDDNRKFTELYNVQRLSSSYIASDSQVCISTIQRLYSVLKGEELDPELEENNPNDSTLFEGWQKKEALPVVYNERIPIEYFDFIVIDECHRSIYNLWKQVLDYFDSFLIGLTATPDKRTFGFFNENVVSEYTYEASVIDGVNVPYDVFTIETEITQNGAVIKAQEFVDRREKLSRKSRWGRLDDDYEYTANQLDRDVVNLSQIRSVIKAYKDALPVMFPDRFDDNNEYEVPKTLVFAKTDSHADDIIQVIREEFAEGNDFCKKITYKTEEDPKSVLNRFRNSWAPRIAVTVDMIATGTDVKPLEVLLFMRDVKSINYFEQMKGRGTRTLNFDDLKRVTRTATHTKTHFVIVDAVGATKSKKTDSRPLERKPAVPLKDLLGAVAVGVKDEDTFVSLANRLIRLDKKITDDERARFVELSNGKDIKSVAKNLIEAYDPDVEESKRNELKKNASSVFNGKLNEYIENVRKTHEQIIDRVNSDRIIKAEWDSYSTEKAQSVIKEFKEYIEANKDEITALSIFYGQPYRRRELTFKMIKEVLERLKTDKPQLAPHYVWGAYAQIEQVRGNSPKNELTALVSLIRRVTEIDKQLSPYDKTVDKNFQDWVFKKHAGSGEKFTDEQMEWLRMLKDHIAASFHIEPDDLDYTPFDAKGGRGRMWKLFGDKTDQIIQELNEALAG